MHSKEQYTLVWESKHLKSLGTILSLHKTEIGKFIGEKSTNLVGTALKSIVPPCKCL